MTATIDHATRMAFLGVLGATGDAEKAARKAGVELALLCQLLIEDPEFEAGWEKARAAQYRLLEFSTMGRLRKGELKATGGTTASGNPRRARHFDNATASKMVAAYKPEKPGAPAPPGDTSGPAGFVIPELAERIGFGKGIMREDNSGTDTKTKGAPANRADTAKASRSARDDDRSCEPAARPQRGGGGGNAVRLLNSVAAASLP